MTYNQNFLVERERTQDNKINIFSVQSSSILITGTMSYLGHKLISEKQNAIIVWFNLN